MCGIAGFYFRDPEFMRRVDSDALLTTLLDGIDVRGRHACGFIALTDDGVGQWQKAAVAAREFNIYRQRVPQGTRALLAHTRFRTQGNEGFMENNHPVRRGPFYIIHNGHVSNDYELFRKAERVRYGQVDSEAIAARLASLGDLSELTTVMEEISGSAAVAAVDERDCTRLVVARGAFNPIFVYNGRRIVIFASLMSTVIKAHEEHVGALSEERLLEMDEGEMFEWRGGDAWTREFKIKRPSYTTPAWKITDEKGGSKSTTTQAETTQGALPAAGMADPRLVKSGESSGIVPVGEDWVLCENCSTKILWEDANYYRPTKVDALSFIVCESCFEELVSDDEWMDDLIQEAIKDGTLSPEDLEDAGPIDDFQGANRNILDRFRGLL